jgi:TonB family protein
MNEIRARLLVVPKPEYPELARSLHHSGTGLYGLYFDVRGEVSGIRIFKSIGYPELDIAVLKTLVRWRAKPGPKWRLKVPVTFTMDERMQTYVNPYHFDYHF